MIDPYGFDSRPTEQPVHSFSTAASDDEISTQLNTSSIDGFPVHIFAHNTGESTNDREDSKDDGSIESITGIQDPLSLILKTALDTEASTSSSSSSSTPWTTTSSASSKKNLDLELQLQNPDDDDEAHFADKSSQESSTLAGAAISMTLSSVEGPDSDKHGNVWPKSLLAPSLESPSQPSDEGCERMIPAIFQTLRKKCARALRFYIEAPEEEVIFEKIEIVARPPSLVGEKDSRRLARRCNPKTQILSPRSEIMRSYKGEGPIGPKIPLTAFVTFPMSEISTLGADTIGNSATGGRVSRHHHHQKSGTIALPPMSMPAAPPIMFIPSQMDRPSKVTVRVIKMSKETSRPLEGAQNVRMVASRGVATLDPEAAVDESDHQSQIQKLRRIICVLGFTLGLLLVATWCGIGVGIVRIRREGGGQDLVGNDPTQSPALRATTNLTQAPSKSISTPNT